MSKHRTDGAGANNLKRRDFIRYAGTAVLVGTTRMMVPPLAESQTPSKWRKVDRGPLEQFPTLSLAERDRRWNIMRRIMRDNKVECLFVPPSQGQDNYFTNDSSATVIFPLAGDPLALPGDTSFTAGAWLQNEERGVVPWIKDWRFGKGENASIAGTIREKGFAKARIGTIGVTKGSHSWPAGNISYGEWSRLQKELPDVTWVELWDPFIVEWLTKSDEDLAVFRKAALMAEVSFEEALEMTKPGVSEADIYATIICAVLHYGGYMGGMNLHSGLNNSSWARPKWAVRAQGPPRVIERQDLINIEIGPYYGHLQSQGQLAIAVGKLPDIYYKLAKTAREQYEIGVKMIKPGIRFGDLANAMNEPNRREGFWHLTPNIHSLNPLDPVGPVTEGELENFSALTERFGRKNLLERVATGVDIVLRPGMCFQLETNSSSGRARVNIGGNVVVTKDGCEELNWVCCEMRQV